MMRRRTVVICLVIVGIAVGCGVQGSSEVHRIPAGQVPIELSATDPPTTTTTTTTPPTSDVNTTLTIESTTTIPSEEVELYFISGGQLQAVTTSLSKRPRLFQVLSALQAGPPQIPAGRGLRTALPRADVAELDAAEDGTGVATVELPSGFFESIPSAADQRFAVAQIVLTLLSRPGVGQVRFSQAGSPIPVVLGDGSQSAVGQPLTALDFSQLLDGGPSLTTSTTVPPDTTPAPPVT